MTTRFLRTRKKSKGLPPGSIIAHPKTEHNVTIEMINYTANEISQKVINSIDECLDDVKNTDTITWINIRGLSDGKIIQEIGETFGIHALWLEDVLNTDHRPKLEELDDIIFCIIKAVDYNKRIPKYVSFEQISLFLGNHFVISFQEHPEDVYKPVVNRLKKKKGRIRESRADYLFYALVDSIVDEYYIVLEGLGSEIEKLEETIFENFDGNIYKEISRLRNELIYLRKSASPIRDVLNQCIKTEKPEVQNKTKKYFKDAYDHIVQCVDTIDSYSQMLDSARDAFSSMQSNKMNEVMKVLTIFAAIFIPLTFIAGIYGMNFEHMPELKWPWGYAFAWVLMISVGIGLALYFKIKKWI